MNQLDIQEMLRTTVERKLQMPPGTLDLHRPLVDAGLDSLELVNLSGDIEDMLRVRIDPTALWDHLTTWELSVFLTKLTGGELDLSKPGNHVDALLSKLGGGE
jgi:acyl carrier protein